MAVRETMAVLAILSLSCSEDLGIESKVFACSANAPCAAGFECLESVCQALWAGPEDAVMLRPLGPPSTYLESDPFAGCDSLRVCYLEQGSVLPRSCTKHQFTSAAPGETIQVTVPRGIGAKLWVGCVGTDGKSVASTAMSCGFGTGDAASAPGESGFGSGEVASDPGEIGLYFLPRRKSGPTIKMSDGSQSRLAEARAETTAAPLPDGRILVAGGVGKDGQVLDTAELFNPRTGEVRALESRLQTARKGAVATTLDDGRIAVFGGQEADGAQSKIVDVFDGASEGFSPGPVLSVARYRHSATTIAGLGKVLVAGGVEGGHGTYEIWSPSEGSLQSAELASERFNHAAVSIPDPEVPGWLHVVLAGGETFPSAQDGVTGTVLDSVVLFHFQGQDVSMETTWLCSSQPDGEGRLGLTGLAAAHLIGTDAALFTGGIGAPGTSRLPEPSRQPEPSLPTAASCLWHQGSSVWAYSGGTMLPMAMPRVVHTVTSAVVPDFSGAAIVGGLYSDGGVLRPVVENEYFVSTGGDGSGSSLGPGGLAGKMVAPRWGHAAVPTCDGRVFIVGGWTGKNVDEAVPTDVTELYNP